MNILFLTSRLPYPPYRGDKLRTFNLIKQVSRSHSVSLLSFIASESEMEHVGGLGAYCREVKVVLHPPARSIWNCAMNVMSGTPFQVAYYRSERMRRTLAEVLARGDFDVIHVHLIRMAQYVREAGRYKRVIDLTDAVSLYLGRFLRTTANPLLKAVLSAELGRLKRYERILENFDRCLVCSEVDRDFLLRQAPKARISILNNGTDIDYFSAPEKPEPEPNRIIFTGNFSYYPNIDGAVYLIKEIFPLIRERVPEAELYIVGNNPPGRLRRLSGGGVTVTGFVPDIRESYIRSTVAVAPLRFGAGTLTKVLEAMALGIPVVSTPISVEGLPLRHGHELLIAGSRDEFALAVVDLLKDAPKRLALASAARSVVRELYGWEKVGGDLEQVYREVMKG